MKTLERKISYAQKLKDPRWQKKRLEIFQRDDWKCKACGDTSQMLCVHHERYVGDPWNCPPEYLVTLCETCHTAITEKGAERETRCVDDIIDDVLWLESTGELTFASHPDLVSLVQAESQSPEANHWPYRYAGHWLVMDLIVSKKYIPDDPVVTRWAAWKYRRRVSVLRSKSCAVQVAMRLISWVTPCLSKDFQSLASHRIRGS